MGTRTMRDGSRLDLPCIQKEQLADRLRTEVCALCFFPWPRAGEVKFCPKPLTFAQPESNLCDKNLCRVPRRLDGRRTRRRNAPDLPRPLGCVYLVAQKPFRGERENVSKTSQRRTSQKASQIWQGVRGRSLSPIRLRAHHLLLHRGHGPH